MTFISLRRAAIALTGGTAMLLLAGCGQPDPGDAQPALPLGYWQATIAIPGAEIETGIELSRDDEMYSASLINGQERVRIDEVTFVNGELRLRFPAFNNVIQATLTHNRLQGTLTLMKRFGDTQVMNFSAVPGNPPPAESNESPNHDMSGRWAVRFHEPDGTDSPAIGEFAQRGSRLFGTFLTPNGDHRYLAGHMRGDRFHLSTFDGAHAFVFSGEISADDTIVNADFWSGTNWHQQWSAERNELAELPDAFSRTYLKPGYEKFAFSFPDQEGNPVSFSDEKYAGKVVVVTIAGTWCPNCNDEARFLAPFYVEYRDRGLEVVALMFEHFDRFETAAAQVREFREKFDLQYDTLIAGTSDKEEASAALPQLNAILAYPTTIFIDRGGRVRHIHTGFSGPGTGEHYEELKDKFEGLVTGLLDEPVDLIETLTNNKPEEQVAE